MVNTNPRKHFITFGAGDINFVEAAQRLEKQVRSLNLYDEITVFTCENSNNVNDLQNDPIFWNKHKDFIKKNKRGYGYWIWKSYIIKKTLEKIPEGDILLYLDAGCEVDIRKKHIMKQFFDYINDNLIITSPNWPEYMWNKMDLIEHLQMNNKKHLDSWQHQGGVIMFLKCSKTMKLVNEWYNTACKYNLLDDTPSKIPNLPGFVEHRHDQSIFSLLVKKNNFNIKKNLNECVEIIWSRSGKSNLK